MYIGAHVSIQGGVHEAPIRARNLGASAMGIFTKNQRQWKAKDLTPEDVQLFRSNLADSGIKAEHVVIHASYLINTANPDMEKRRRSVEALLDECLRAEALGLSRVNFHPGSGLGEIPKDEAIQAVADAMKEVLDRTDTAVPVLEVTAGQGAHVGHRFEQIGEIIRLSGGGERLGLCLDTCHAFAAGYDLAASEGYSEMMERLKASAGLERLTAVHLNDSKVELGSRKDRHESIGAGFIGVEGLRHIVTDPELADVPFILETPKPDYWAAEIDLMRRMRAGEIGE